MFVIPHLVKAVRRILKRSEANEATSPTVPQLPSAPTIVRFVPKAQGTQQEDAPRVRNAGEYLDEVLAEFKLNQKCPLVRIDDYPSAANGFRVGVVFVDRAGSGSEYDFYCRDALDALCWVRHLAEKTWVTNRHLEAFAALMVDQFDPPRAA